MENLRLRCPYFYDVALLLHGIERGPPLADFAMKTFQARYKARSVWCNCSCSPGGVASIKVEAMLFVRRLVQYLPLLRS